MVRYQSWRWMAVAVFMMVVCWQETALGQGMAPAARPEAARPAEHRPAAEPARPAAPAAAAPAPAPAAAEPTGPEKPKEKAASPASKEPKAEEKGKAKGPGSGPGAGPGAGTAGKQGEGEKEGEQKSKKRPGCFGGQYSMLIMLGLMFVAFYFLLIRPQQKKQKEHQTMLEALKVGDQVLTQGGILGKISGFSEPFVVLELQEKVRIKILRNAISGKHEGQKPLGS